MRPALSGSAGTDWGHFGVEWGGRELPPDRDSPNKNGPDRLWLSWVVWLRAAHNPKVGGSNPPPQPTLFAVRGRPRATSSHLEPRTASGRDSPSIRFEGRSPGRRPQPGLGATAAHDVRFQGACSGCKDDGVDEGAD